MLIHPIIRQIITIGHFRLDDFGNSLLRRSDLIFLVVEEIGRDLGSVPNDIAEPFTRCKKIVPRGKRGGDRFRFGWIPADQLNLFLEVSMKD